MSERWPFVQHLLLAAVLFCILARFFAVGLEEVCANENSSGLDQRSYLNLGLKMRAGKRLTDGNRHPLYPAMLSLFARREWAYFTGGKLISLTTGVLSLFVIFWLVRRLQSTEAALAVVLALSSNPIFQRVTSHVMAESLLVGLVFVAWYLTVQGFLDRRLWIGAGATAALAYLTKGTGQLLPMAFIPTVFLRYGRHARRVGRGLAGYLAAYCLVAMPLWVYNLNEYGDPLYSWSTTHAMWFDGWEDKYTQGRLPTILSFLSTHSIPHVLARQWRGLSRVLPVWAEALMPSDSWLWLLGLSVLLLASTFVRRRSTVRQLRELRAERLYAGLLVVTFYLLFGWYAQVVTAPRFFLPLTPLVYVYVTDAFACIWRQTARWLDRLGLPGHALPRGLYLVVCVGLLLGLATDRVGAFQALGRDPFALDREHNAESDALFAWSRANLSPSGNLLWGPSTTFGSWRYEEGYDFEDIPSDADSWDDLESYIRDERCTYAIVDSHTYYRRQELLSPYFSVQDDLIHIRDVPSDWALTYVQSSLPCRWCVFQLLDQQPMSSSLSLTLGSQIRLIGYDVPHPRIQPGEDLRFTLYWQTLAPISENFTVFTHLLAPEGRLLAQLDGQPLQGRVPTGKWLPGAIYADRYDMRLSPDIASDSISWQA
jgi:hypothetical protein